MGERVVVRHEVHRPQAVRRHEEAEREQELRRAHVEEREGGEEEEVGDVGGDADAERGARQLRLEDEAAPGIEGVVDPACVETKCYCAFVVLHAIDATPARSSPLDRAGTAAPSPRNALVEFHTGPCERTATNPHPRGSGGSTSSR